MKTTINSARAFGSRSLAIFALVTAGACSSNAPLHGGQGGAGGATSAGTGGAPSVLALDAGSGTGAPDADPSLPAGYVAAPPPDVACTGQADAAVECDLPMSTCAMPSCDGGGLSCGSDGTWIVYYENPRCVAGHCVWDQGYFRCESATFCSGGACQSILSTS